MPAPTTVTRSPSSGAASHSALTAVSTVPARTARAGGTPSGTTRHGARRHDVGGLVRVQAEDRAAAQLRRSLLHDADVEVAVLDRPREAPPPGTAPASRRTGPAAHRPRNTNVSVPRLTPDRKVRTSTSSRPGSGSVTGRISPQPGARSQNACASICTGLTLPDLGVNGSLERKPAQPRTPGRWRGAGPSACPARRRLATRPRPPPRALGNSPNQAPHRIQAARCTNDVWQWDLILPRARQAPQPPPRWSGRR